MTWFVVWDPDNSGGDNGEPPEDAWGVDASDPEDAAEMFMDHGEENSWWSGGDEYPSRLLVLENAKESRDPGEIRHTVDVVVDYSPTFTAYSRPLFNHPRPEPDHAR